MLTEVAQKALDNLKVGDVLVGCSSYSMVFYNFYRVIGKTAASVKIQKMPKLAMPGGDLASTRVIPDFAKIGTNPIVTRRVSRSGAIQADGEYSDYIPLTNKYDEKAKYCECYLD